MTTESRIHRVYDVAMFVDMIYQTPSTAARRRAAYRTMKRRLFKLDTIARRRARRAARKEARAMQDPDITCARCGDGGQVATDFGIVRCDCNAGKTVDFIPDRTPEQHRATAYAWHGGQWSPLYQWASTNGEHYDYDGLMTEVEACVGQARLECNETEYDNLRSLRRHLAVTCAPEIDYDAVPF